MNKFAISLPAILLLELHASTVITAGHSARAASTNFTVQVQAEAVDMFGQSIVEIPTYHKPVDLDQYLRYMERKIQAQWHPTGDTDDYRAKISFTLSSDGTLSDLLSRNVTGNFAADHAILAAIEKVAPFEPLPKQAGNHVTFYLEGTAQPEPRVRISVDRAYWIASNRPYRMQMCSYPGLTALWSKTHLDAPHHQFSVLLNLNEEGALPAQNMEVVEQIFRSSGNQLVDDIAMDCIRQAAPFDLKAFDKKGGQYLVNFDIDTMKVSLTYPPSIDWRPYAANVASRVKKHWLPPSLGRSSRAAFGLTVGPKGEISHLRLIEGRISNETVALACELITDCAPFWDLPQGAPDYIDMIITFSNPAISRLKRR